MDEVPAGLIEIVLVFGAILGLATWEVVRNRRALARLRRGEGSGERAGTGRSPPVQ